LIWRKRIPPTGQGKLNLEESQNESACQKYEIAVIGFSEFDFYDLYRSTFEKSELGRIKKLLPLHEMAENFGLVSRSMRPKLGRKSFFTPEGKVALMFLKMHTGGCCWSS
jgi:hypothetical protein